MKFGLLLRDAQARFPGVPFFQYDDLKQLVEAGCIGTSDKFLSLLDAELQTLDRVHETMAETCEADSFHYKWSQLNAVAVAKIVKKWNRHNSHCGTISFSRIAKKLQETKFYRKVYAWTTPSEKIECPICLEVVTNPVRYSDVCDHRFCATCAVATACRKEFEGRCPVCRQGGFETLSLEPLQNLPRFTKWPKASTLLSSFQRLEQIADTEETDPPVDEKHLQKLQSSTPPGEEQSAQLSVMTFNLLAPVWASPQLYPAVEERYLDPEARRRAQHAHICRADADIIFLQECQETELDLLLSAGRGILREKYDVEYCPFPLTFWSHWLTEVTNFEPRRTGVCVWTKKQTVAKLSATFMPLDPPGSEFKLPPTALGAQACAVLANVSTWSNATVLLVASHLDAESVRRASTQGLTLARRALDMAAEYGAETVIWGGDFNMESRSRMMAGILAEGFEHVSGSDDRPSVVGLANIRVDHVLLRSPEGAVRPQSAEVPTIPVKGTWRSKRFSTKFSFVFEGLAEWTQACLSRHISQLQDLRPVLEGEDGRLLRTLAVVACLALSPAFIVLLALTGLHLWVHGYTRHALWEWALTEYGSDHLPVCVRLIRDGRLDRSGKH